MSGTCGVFANSGVHGGSARSHTDGVPTARGPHTRLSGDCALEPAPSQNFGEVPSGCAFCELFQ